MGWAPASEEDSLQLGGGHELGQESPPPAVPNTRWNLRPGTLLRERGPPFCALWCGVGGAPKVAQSEGAEVLYLFNLGRGEQGQTKSL